MVQGLKVTRAVGLQGLGFSLGFRVYGLQGFRIEGLYCPQTEEAHMVKPCWAGRHHLRRTRGVWDLSVYVIVTQCQV